MPSIELQTMPESQSSTANASGPPLKSNSEFTTTEATVAAIDHAEDDLELAVEVINTTPLSPFSADLADELLFLLALGLSQFSITACIGNTAFSFPQIAEAFAVTDEGILAWFVSSYCLATGVFIWVGGRLGDHLGPKFVLVFGCIFMGVMLFMARWAWSVEVFLGFRAATSIGAAVMIPNSVTLFYRAYPDFSVKGIPHTYTGFYSPLGYIVGGFVGAVCAQSASWSWSFWLWAIACISPATAAALFVPHNIGGSLSGLNVWHFDVLGSFFGIAGLAQVSVACGLAAVDGLVWVNMVWLAFSGFSILFFFGLTQNLVRAPILPNSLWRRIKLVPTAVAVALNWMAFGIFLYHTPIFVFAVHHKSPETALALMTAHIVGAYLFTLALCFREPQTPMQCRLDLSMLSSIIGNIIMICAWYSDVYEPFVVFAGLFIAGGSEPSVVGANDLMYKSVLFEERRATYKIIATVTQCSMSIGIGLAAFLDK